MHDNVDHPVSLYAASKKANELMAHYCLRSRGAVPTWLCLFSANAILSGKPINVVQPRQDAPPIHLHSDIAEAIIRLIDQPPQGDAQWNGRAPDPAASKAARKIYNIGNSHPEELSYVISLWRKNSAGSRTSNWSRCRGKVEPAYADTAA